MTYLPSQRETELEAEVTRLRAELAKLRERAAASTDRHGQELATSEEVNLGLVEGERRHALLLAELNHRVKNILATVQGLAAQTLKGTGGDPVRFAKHFVARLRTLARAHDMLTELGWEAAGVEDTVRKALAPWLETGKGVRIGVSAECTRFKVSPRQTQALVLALHELATNATKYGALSAATGHVGISCVAGVGGTMKILWEETGGPPVITPIDRRGFGTRLLERGLGQDLGPGSTVKLQFEPLGLRAVIHFTPALRA
jgi:two-component sensor histidine kinase